MEKIVIINSDKAAEIKQIGSVLKIKSIIYNGCHKDAQVQDIVEGNNANECDDNNVINDRSLLLMCDLSDKHVDKVLAKLREKKIVVDYKAILTATNKKWTVGKLFSQLEFEKLQYANR